MSRKIKIAVTAALIFSIVLMPFLSTNMHLTILPAHCTDSSITCNGTILINATNIYLVNSTGTFPLGLNNSFISTSDNVTYTFQNNINSNIGISNDYNASAVTIDRDNVTLDGAGKKLNCSYNGGLLQLRGISITGRSNLCVKNLTVSNFTSYYLPSWPLQLVDNGGIVIAYSSKVFVYDCVCVNNMWGDIVIYHSNDTYVYRNQIIDHQIGYGLDLFDVNNLQVAYNSIYGSPLGGGSEGVCGYASNVFYFGNNFTTANLGITSSGATSGANNTVTHNKFYLGTVVLCAARWNKIYHNNMTSASASDMELNYFDNGYPSGGNYWSSYDSNDTCKGPGQNVSGADHVIDYWYNITTDSTNCIDNYPFKFAYNLTSDANDDNVVNMRDMSAVIVAYGTQPGDAKWNYFADVSLDGFIDNTDIQLVQATFNQKMVLWP